jgi:hypothetical protein
MIPYTYYLRWTDLDLHYYGCRYKKGCNPSDLFKSYFTSSKKVHALLSEGKFPDIIKIRKTFETASQTIAYETRFLQKVKAAQKTKWVNCSNGAFQFHITEETARKIGKANKGRIPSIDTRKKMSLSRMGRVCSSETRIKIRDTQKGRPLSLEHRKKLSGRTFTEDHKEKLRLAKLGKPSPRRGAVLSLETRQKISDTKRIKREIKNG